MTECIECGAQVAVPGDVIYGEVLDCTDCGVEMVVTSTSPVSLKMVESTQEDWGE